MLDHSPERLALQLETNPLYAPLISGKTTLLSVLLCSWRLIPCMPL